VTGATWSSINVTDPSLIDDRGNTLSTFTARTTPLAVNVYPPNTTYYFLNGSDVIDTASASANCISGTTWNNSICAPMSGTLTATNCTIPYGSSSCNTTLNWSTTYPVATSAVTTPTSITVATGNSGTTTYPVSYGSRIFYLYNNNIKLNEKTATATCPGDWNGTTCEAPVTPTMSGSLSPSSSSCTIPIGGNSCNVTLSWSIAYPEGTPTAITASGMTDQNVTTTLTTPQSGTKSVPVPYTYSPRTFYLYNNSQSLDTVSASSSCQSGSTWNGTMCEEDSSPSMSGSISASNCTIAYGDAGCDSNLVWSTSNPVSTSAVTSSYPSAGTEVATGNSGNTSIYIPYNSRTFYLYNNGDLLDQDTASATCPGEWNTTTEVCDEIIITPSPTSTLSLDPTSIVIGGSATLSWTSNHTTSCTGTGFDTGGAISGSISVNPTVTTTYSLQCTGPGGVSYDTKTLTVTTADTRKKPIYSEQ
jgi:hypothetical protein